MNKNHPFVFAKKANYYKKLLSMSKGEIELPESYYLSEKGCKRKCFSKFGLKTVRYEGMCVRCSNMKTKLSLRKNDLDKSKTKKAIDVFNERNKPKDDLADLGW